MSDRRSLLLRDCQVLPPVLPSLHSQLGPTPPLRSCGTKITAYSVFGDETRKDSLSVLPDTSSQAVHSFSTGIARMIVAW